MFKRIPGTKDILPAEVILWQRIEEKARSIFSRYNFQEIRPPLIEEASLFNRSLGESAEIVRKQMFLVRNQDDLYALRPEGTASVVRAYVENSLDKTAGFVKLYYMGPMFRLERPQKGRLRQFHHIGVEAIGSQDPDLDVEIISLADELLRSFSVQGHKIKVNSLGCPKDKSALNSYLRGELKGKADALCDDCKIRHENNVLRILDCKNESCRRVVDSLKIGDFHLCPECKGHFARVVSGLDSLKIGYEVAHHLVRGLDYYTRTVFEITHEELGAQDAVGAGGRYNNLVGELGGPDLGAVGFAFGVERLLLAAKLPPQAPSGGLVYLICLGDEAKKEGVKILDSLRKGGVAADTDYEAKSLKAAMRKANDLGAGFALIIGDDELKKNAATVKNMASGEQREVALAELTKELKC